MLHGAVAQLGERLNGIQEVSGSIPLSSTFLTKDQPRFYEVFFIHIHNGLYKLLK
tara:strand:+ start:222 stop:386 length:165 start_codon:yes stop_codon:yes gene_type:complete